MINKGKIITVTSVKGGTGKTTFLLSLAGQYEKNKKKVLIIDMDLFSGDVEAILDIESKKDIYTIYEDITNNNFEDVDTYINKATEYIDFIASPKDPRYATKMNGNFLNLLFSRVAARYDVILIDTNHFLNSINLMAFDFSSQIYYVINNNSMNLKNMRSMNSIFTDMNVDNYKIVLYEAKDKNAKVFAKFDIKNIIKDKIDYIIPTDFYMRDIEKHILSNNFLHYSKEIIRKRNIRMFDKIVKDTTK